MNTRYRSLGGVVITLFCVLAGLRFSATASRAPSQSPAPSSDVKISEGLSVVTYRIDQGNVVVKLPDDLMAGDTISGTVIAEPNGQTKAERDSNLNGLEGCVIEFRTQQLQKQLVSRIAYTFAKTLNHTSEMFSLTLPRDLPPPAAGATGLFLKDKNGRDLGFAPLVIFPLRPGNPAVVTPDSKTAPRFIIPPMGQAGRPIVITGPFDGDSSNTSLSWKPTGGAAPDSEKNSAKDSGNPGLLAESPRKCVFVAPTNVTGPIELRLKEGSNEVTGSFRNIGVNLSAPKTNLLKGERTTLTVRVEGLQGITQPVPLHLVKGGVVTMQGGDMQTMQIKPAEVQQNGTFTTTRTIIGVQAGVWSATATVVVFDVCLQDDTNGNSIILSRDTGDYVFCPGRSLPSGANPILLNTLNLDLNGAVTVITPEHIEANGTISPFKFEQDLPDRHILISIDWGSFPASGRATVQTTKPRQEFTITDRDTRNNSCVCR